MAVEKQEPQTEDILEQEEITEGPEGVEGEN